MSKVQIIITVIDDVSIKGGKEVTKILSVMTCKS